MSRIGGTSRRRILARGISAQEARDAIEQVIRKAIRGVAMREERMRETAPYVARCCLLATFNAGLAWLNLRARTESVWPLLIATFSATAAIYATTFPVRELSRWGSMYLWERRVRAWVAQASEELRELEEANGIQGTREP